MITAAGDGWPNLRLAVLRRDRGCVAVQNVWPSDGADVRAEDLCRDQWGQAHPFDAIFKLQLDHVNEWGTLRRKAPDDEAHLQAVCAFHHRVWATRALSRSASRERLAGLYPEPWKEWLER